MIADGISLRSLRKLPVDSLWSIQILSFSRAMMVIRRTGNLEIASKEFYEHEICVRVHTGWLLFSVGESWSPRVMWSGTRREIGHKHLMDVIIRVC